MTSHSRSRQFCFSELEVRPSDVVTVRDALLTCDVGLLLPVVVNAEAGWRLPVDGLDAACVGSLQRKVEAALHLMAGMPVSDEGLREGVIVPWEWIEVVDAQGLLRRHVSVAVFDEKDAAEADATLRQGACRVASMDGLREAQARLALSEAGKRRSSCRSLAGSALSLAFEPWSEVLSRRVWLPQSLCEKERYYVLGSIFWAMTYWGFDAARVRGSSAGEGAFRDVAEAVLGMRLSEGPGFSELCAPLSPPSKKRCRTSLDQDYVARLERVAELSNYNSWVDVLGAVCALAHLKDAA